MNRRRLDLNNNEQGIVAIAVSMIIIIIVSLITLGFARLMQREQRQSLDRQLSTQAFYAAESAINDARRELKSGKQIEKDSCPPDANVPKYGGAISNDGAVDYTCLLVNSALPDIRYSDITMSRGRQVALQTNDGAAVSRIRIEWERSGTFNDFGTGSTTLPPKSSWPTTRPDVMRTVVFKKNGSGTFDSQTIYFIPAPDSTGAGTAAFTANGSPQIVTAKCLQTSGSREYACIADITGSFLTTQRDKNNVSDQGATVVAMTGVYLDRSTSVRVSAFNGAATTANQRLLVNSQYRVDATGKASDVLRRLQVRVSQALDYYVPDRAIETTQGICKRFLTEPSSTRADDSDGCLP